MEKSSGKEILVEVFKRLKTKNNRLKGGEKLIMKKFLSVLITVTMIFSLVAAFRAPVAKAAVTAITITDSKGTLEYFDGVPDWAVQGDYHKVTTQYVYTMGDIIHGTFTTDATGAHTIYLTNDAGVMVDSVTVNVPVVGTYPFTLATVNARYDGMYYITQTLGGGAAIPVYIKYYVAITKSSFESTCATSYTVEGYVTRATGYPDVAVDVFVAYPDYDGVDNGSDGYRAGQYHINPTSGFFTITFPADGPDGDSLPDVGAFRIYIRDGYSDPNLDNDAIIYKTISNIPTISVTLNTYITPFLYQGVNNQPILLVLTDQNGNYVTGATITVESGGSLVSYQEVSPGFYRAVVNVTGGSAFVVFKATKNFGFTSKSDTLMVNTRVLGVYNPYIDLTALYPMAPYPTGTGPGHSGPGYWQDAVQNVYDKLPCTIGNIIALKVDYYPPADPEHWKINSFKWKVTGPVTKIGTAEGYNGYLITEEGKISVTMSFVAWKRAFDNCDFDEYNACCETFSKTVDICEINSCVYGGVTLTGANITDSTTVQVGKKVDKLSISIDPTGAPADLVCSCPNYIVAMYMIDSKGYIIDDAFTVDTWSGTAKTGGMIWYNPVNATGPDKGPDPDKDKGVLKDQPVQTFLPTGLYTDYDAGKFVTADLKFGDCPFNLYGIKFNYPTDTDCDYTLVIKVFGLERIFDVCGGVDLIYPMIAEDWDPLTVTPSVTTLTATGTIWEGDQDPDQILAGIATVIDITNPKFTLANGPYWEFYLNGDSVGGISVAETETGYRFTGICLAEAGTFEIYGYAYNANCTKYEEVTLEFEVVVPEFTVKIGLMDGSVIDNDNILTEGFSEILYVTPVDPRGLHDFSYDVWSLYVEVANNACGLAPAVVCDESVPGVCCGRGALAVTGYDNPCLEDDPLVDLYFHSPCGADIYIDSFKLVPPTVKVDPAEVPFTIPATATHVTFTVTDAHGHGAPGVSVYIYGAKGAGASASGYSFSARGGITGKKGEVDWGFVPPNSGMYVISAEVEDTCFDLPDGEVSFTQDFNGSSLGCLFHYGIWGINTSAKIEAVYQAPVIDTTAPVVTATAPAKVAVSMVKVTGKATDNAGVVSVWIGAKKADLAPDGTFEAVVELVEGANTLKVVAYDAAGNKGEATVTVTYEVKKITVVKLTIGQDIMTVNGKAVQLDAAPEIVDGRTFLPLRAIAEIFGATVEWIPDTKGVTVTLGDNTIGLQIGNPTAVINGNVVDIVAPYIKNGRTMVPLRVIAEGLGATVEWDPVYRIVTITM